MTVTCHLQLPNQSQLHGYIARNAKRGLPTVTFGEAEGRTLALCGAGPSLADTWQEIDADDVWACNSALPYLMGRGARVTHGVTIDQNAEMLGPSEWETTYGVEYLVASSVHPKLVAHLLKDGRRVRFFHSFIGIPGEEEKEQELYTRFATSVMVAHGLNTVPRAACLALAMGYREISIYGADCAAKADPPEIPVYGTPQYEAWLNKLVMYADGRTFAQCFDKDEYVAGAVIDGQRWYTRPDMSITALCLVELQRGVEPGRIRFVGNTLPKAIEHKGDEFLSRMPRLPAFGRIENLNVLRRAS